MSVIVRGMDQYEMTFSKLADLQAELNRREGATTRPVVQSSDLRFVTAGEAEVLGMMPNVLEELIEDTKANSDLIVNACSVPFLVAETAFNTIKGRIEIYGPGFDKLQTRTKKLVLNERFGDLGKEVRLVVTDDKVRAILSAGSSQSYAVMPMAELLQQLTDAIALRFERPQMSFAQLTYVDLVSRFTFPELKDELTTLYGLPEKWIPGLRIMTSDTGDAANSITPYWTRPGSSRGMAIQSESIYQEHRGSITVKDVVDQLPKLFARFVNVAEWMTNAMSMEVVAPKGFLAALGKHLGLSKKFVLSVLAVYDAYSRPTVTTVYTLAEHLFEALDTYENSTSDALENQIGKLFTLSQTQLQRLIDQSKDDEETVESFKQLTLV